MSIFSYLYSERSGDYCEYNGDLKEYILCRDQDDPERIFLDTVLKRRPNIRVCVNYHIPIVENSISNMIIRYKDVMKLDRNILICPYIFYMSDEKRSNAIIVSDDYLLSLGLYYVATEKDGVFNDYKNFIIATDKDIEHLDLIMDEAFTKRPSEIQRELDHINYTSFDDLYENAQRKADMIKEEATDEILKGADRAKVIQKAVSDWYLLKKTVYVRYMVDKEILNEVHGGDNRAQRSRAKRLADGIKFIAIADMWRISK